MKTITIDVVNENVMRILQDLELLQLIRIHRGRKAESTPSNQMAKYKGAMTKQSLEDTDTQQKELRNW